MFLLISCLWLLASSSTDKLQDDPVPLTIRLQPAYASQQYQAKDDITTLQTFKARLCQPGNQKGLYITVEFRNPQNPGWNGCDPASAHFLRKNRNLKGQDADAGPGPTQGGVLGFDIASNKNFTLNLHSSYTSGCQKTGPGPTCACLKSTLQVAEPFDPVKWGSDMIYLRARGIYSQMQYSFEINFQKKPFSATSGVHAADLKGHGSLFDTRNEWCNDANNCQWLHMNFKANACDGACKVITNEKIVFTTPMCLAAKNWRGNFEISSAGGPSAFEVYMCSLATVVNYGAKLCSRYSIREKSGRSVDWLPVARVSGGAEFALGGGFGISVRGVGGAPWNHYENVFYINGFQSNDPLN